MFDYIKGKVTFLDPQYVVVELDNIGYQIYSPNPYIFQLDKVVTVYTHQYVREDLIRLYGFKSRDERAMFEKLLNVSGIGPKGALAILAAGEPNQLITAIEEENEKFLVKFPGVGKKTARQIILDLKGKLTEFTSLQFGEVQRINILIVENPDLDEAVEALKALGYIDREINKILPQLKQEELTTDQYIKKGLQLMLRG